MISCVYTFLTSRALLNLLPFCTPHSTPFWGWLHLYGTYCHLFKRWPPIVPSRSSFFQNLHPCLLPHCRSISNRQKKRTKCSIKRLCVCSGDNGLLPMGGWMDGGKTSVRPLCKTSIISHVCNKEQTQQNLRAQCFLVSHRFVVLPCSHLKCSHNLAKKLDGARFSFSFLFSRAGTHPHISHTHPLQANNTNLPFRFCLLFFFCHSGVGRFLLLT